MRVLIGLCKVDQYPVPLWCANTGAGFFCNSVGKVSRFGLFKSVKKFSFRLFSNSLRLGETDDGKSKISRHIRRSSAFREKTKPKNYLDVLRVDGHFITELKRKVRIPAFCMVANCPHGICGQNGIPKFPQIGAELPAKSGNAKGRKSSESVKLL